LSDPRDRLILLLNERVYICSRLLTCAAERLGWDAKEVRELVKRLDPENVRAEEVKVSHKDFMTG